MALKGIAFVMTVIMCYTLLVSSSTHGRKLLANVQHNTSFSSSSSDRSLYLTALPKGNVPASTPTNKGHAATTDQKLTALRHLAAVYNRILTSVPSPDVGH
ncbi:hypothetical protein ACP275_13G173100 [Erythranthe tilingii]